MTACPVCYRDLVPVGGRCPACGADRSGEADQVAELIDDEPTGRGAGRSGSAAPPAAPPGDGPRLILKGAGGPAEFPLGDANVLGRSTQATVRLADREVSRKHSQIDREGQDFVLHDLGSSNGTFLNGKRIFGPSRLNDGDEVLIGVSRMEFRLGAGDEGAAAIVHMEPAGAPLEGVVARVEAKANFAPADQVRDVQQLKRDYERLRIGHEFSRYVRLERDLGELLSRILAIAFDLIPADNGVILLRDPGSQELVIQSMRLLKQVQATHQGVLTSDAISDERFSTSQSIIALGVRSAMAVPLLSGDEVKGIMFLDSRERVAAFTTKDLEVLSAIAAQASVALENSEYARA